MKRQDVRAEIHCLIAEIMDNQFIADDNDLLRDDLLMDDLDILELIIELEKKYKISITDEVFDIETFGGFIDYVHNIIKDGEI